MTIQITSIISPFLTLPNEGKVELIAKIRHMKMVEKPGVKQRKVKAAKKASVKRSSKAKNTALAVAKNMSKEELLKMMEMLQ